MARLLVVSLLFAQFLAAAEPVVFTNPRYFVAGGHELTAGDFDGDGRQDFIYVEDTKAIVTMRGHGDGTFDRVTTSVPYYGSRIVTANINGDERLDFTMSSGQPGEIVFFLARADGTFDANTFTPPSPGGLAFGEFTGDGVIDLFVGGSTISVFPGVGQGRFGSAIQTPIEATGNFTVGDLNHDGKADALGGRKWYLGKGDGTFSALPEFPFHSGELHGVADFNGDTYLDRAHSDFSESRVVVFLGKSDGTFHPGTEWPVAHTIDDLDLADLNRDGKADMVAASASPNYITVLLGRGDGTFAGPAWYLPAFGAHQVEVADYDGDSKPDVLVWGDRAAVLRGNGDGTLEAHSAYLLRVDEGSFSGVAVYPSKLELGDATGDGKLDAITMTEVSGTSKIAVLPGLGGGKFGPAVYTPTFDAGPFVTGDFDGDSKLDVVAVWNEFSTHFYFFAGNGDGTFAPPSPGPRLTGQFPRVLFAADVTRDGRLDILALEVDELVVHPGEAGGRFGQGIATRVNPGYSISIDNVAVIDMNHDALPDVVMQDTVFLSSGDGRFSKVVERPEEQAREDLLGVIDLDGDGHPDVVMQFLDLALFIRRGKGDGSLHPATSFAFDFNLTDGPFSEPVEIADVNGDGNPDIAAGTSVLLGDGRGGFSGFERFRYRATSFDIACADLDGNGWADLLSLTDYGIDVVLTGIGGSLELPASVTVETRSPSVRYPNPVTFTTAAESVSSPYDFYGAVRFDEGGRWIGISVLDSSGKGSAQALFEPGVHSISATFLRNDLYAESRGSLNFTMTKGTRALYAAAAPNPVAAGAPVILSWEFGFAGFAQAEPSGTITVRSGSTTIATLDAASGKATVTFPGLAPGTHAITLQYSGDVHYEPVTATYQLDVRERASTMTLTATQSPVPGGSTVSLKATLNPVDATGTVTFYHRGSTVGSPRTVVAGEATYSGLNFWDGSHEITAVYSGDPIFAATSATMNLWVGPLPPRRRSVGKP